MQDLVYLLVEILLAGRVEVVGQVVRRPGDPRKAAVQLGRHAFGGDRLDGLVQEPHTDVGGPKAAVISAKTSRALTSYSPDRSGRQAVGFMAPFVGRGPDARAAGGRHAGTRRN